MKELYGDFEGIELYFYLVIKEVFDFTDDEFNHWKPLFLEYQNQYEGRKFTHQESLCSLMTYTYNKEHKKAWFIHWINIEVENFETEPEDFMSYFQKQKKRVIEDSMITSDCPF